jgi:hypothetical protein
MGFNSAFKGLNLFLIPRQGGILNLFLIRRLGKILNLFLIPKKAGF